LAEVGRAHQAGDRAVKPAMRPIYDLTRALLDRCGGPVMSTLFLC
jgi:hypothetical protein